jgi:hypothetical protein
VPPEIEINRELKNEDKLLAMAHEAGHLAHDLATKMSLDSVRKVQAELTRVYDLVIEPMRGLPRFLNIWVIRTERLHSSLSPTECAPT